MYAGKIVEEAPVADLYAEPKHPYTLALLRSVPRLDRKEKAMLDTISGQPPDLVCPPPGCRFAPRCRFAQAQCREEAPPLRSLGDGRFAACFIDI
jgi:oligopeptide/dipeptide ABC transporter ATP-binding protein